MFEMLDAIIATVAMILGLSLIVQAVQQIVKQSLSVKASYMERELTMLFMPDESLEKLRSEWKSFRKKMIPQSWLFRTITPENRQVVDELKTKLQSVGYTDLEVLENFDAQKLNQMVESLPMFVQEGMQDRLAKVKEDIEVWFEFTKKSFQEHYERRMKVWSFGISLATVIILNANVIAIYSEFSTNKSRREAVVAVAPKLIELADRERAVAPGEAMSDQEINAFFKSRTAFIDSLAKDQTLDIIRWNSPQGDPLRYNANLGGSLGQGFSDFLSAIPHNIIGWLAMTLLVSLGAPFWYDVLKAVTGVKERFKSGGERSENGKPTTPPTTGGSVPPDIPPVG